MSSTPLSYILRRLREEHEYHARREPDVFWVTDLCLCPRKRELELALPALNVWHPEPRLLHAILLHAGVEQFLAMYVRDVLCLTPLVEKEFLRRVELDGQDVAVKGRPDVTAVSEEGEEVVFEVKTGRAGQELPHVHHLEQVKYYMWLTGAREGWLVYVTPDRFCEFRLQEPFTDEDVVNAMRATEAPRYDWECRLCHLRAFCAIASRRREGK